MVQRRTLMINHPLSKQEIKHQTALPGVKFKMKNSIRFFLCGWFLGTCVLRYYILNRVQKLTRHWRFFTCLKSNWSQVWIPYIHLSKKQNHQQAELTTLGHRWERYCSLRVRISTWMLKHFPSWIKNQNQLQLVSKSVLLEGRSDI